VIFSGGHYSLMFVTNSARPDLPGPEIANATADQLRAVWGPLTANSGTFQVSGNTLTTRSRVAKNTFVMASGAIQEFTFTVKGDTLTLSVAKGVAGVPPNPYTLHLVRAK
jgi:Lipocalin-like domain